MKTRAVQVHGKQDIRLEEFELPAIKPSEILMEVVCDSVCMSTHKAVKIGSEHWLISDDVAENPAIIGHEFSGRLIEIGSDWTHKYSTEKSYTVQPALKDLSIGIPGYSTVNCGGSATYIILPKELLEQDNLLEFNSEYGFYNGSMAEPISCNIGAFHSMYHTKRGVYEHEMGIKPDGKCAMFASCGPMGLGGIGYLLNTERKPSILVITDIDQAKLDRAESIFTKEYAKERGVDIHFVNTAEEGSEEVLSNITNGEGFDDISVYAPVPAVIELADRLLAKDGCLNFFSGPTNTELKAQMNFYNVHYKSTHVVGTSGGNTDDMREYLELSSAGKLNPAYMITHIGGLNAVVDTVYNLPSIPGGKKLIYTHLDLELTAIDDFRKLGESNPLFARLADIVEANNGMWCVDAENLLLSELK